VAVNQFAGRPTMTLDDLRHAVNVDPDVPVVNIDARSRDQVKAVVLTLLHRILARAKARRGD
jgi:signal recognition particle receptor subunit beta